MSVANLQSLLSKGIHDDLSYLELRAFLIDFKEEGGQPEEAISILEKLKSSYDSEEALGRVDELIDLVEGQGIKSLKVW